MNKEELVQEIAKKACKIQNNVYNEDYKMCKGLIWHTLESTSV